MSQLVSIIIPTYNRSILLEKCLSSVLAQTYSLIEIIVIDDGSTDDTQKNMEKFKGKVKYFYQSNQGVAYARNKGIELSKGDYISFLDSDDIIFPDKIEKQVNCLLESDTEVCYCGTVNIDNNNNVINVARNSYRAGDVLIDYLFNKITPNTNSWLIKKDVIVENQLKFRSGCSWGEDMEFFTKVLFYAQASYVPENLVGCRKHDQERLSGNDLKKIEEDYFIWDEIAKWIELNSNEAEKVKEVNNAIYNYRIPALILYRINNNLRNKEASYYWKKFNKKILCLNMSNGTRSVKLWIFLIKVKLYFLTKS